MRRFLLALLMTSVVASLQAITIKWQVANTGLTWADELAWADEGVFSTYLVYSQTEVSTAKQVCDGTGYNGYKVSPGATLGVSGSVTAINTPTVGAAKLNSYMTFGFESFFTENQKAYVNVDLEGSAFGSGFFYLVVFQTNPEGTNALYAVSQAVKYTTDESNASNGIYDITVDDAAPEFGDYVEIGWLGTGTKAVPEPTALALLALGVAGLALRRKI